MLKTYEFVVHLVLNSSAIKFSHMMRGITPSTCWLYMSQDRKCHDIFCFYRVCNNQHNMSDAKAPSTPVSALNPEQACCFSVSWFVLFPFFYCLFVCIFSFLCVCLFVCPSVFLFVYLFVFPSLFVCLFVYLFTVMCLWWTWMLFVFSFSIFILLLFLIVNPYNDADGQDGEKAGGDTRWSPHGHRPHPCS